MLHGNWWEIFNQPELNDLEAQLNINNQNIKVFFENYLAARAQIREARAQYYPTVTVGASATRSHTAGTATGARQTSGGTSPNSRFPPTSPGLPTSSAAFATRFANSRPTPKSAPPT